MNQTQNPQYAETNNENLSKNLGDTSLIPTQQNVTDEQNYKLEIGFKNLSYNVKTKLFNRETKNLLNGITGHFKPGLLSVIVGPSGAGKSTLLHLLSSYKYYGYTGNITVNGKPRVLKLFKPNVAFIAQDTDLQPFLTVNEAMFFAANFKIGKFMTRSEKRDRVKKVLMSIGIYEDRHTKTLSLSGGQKKRLSIAIELVNDPPVLILDEPTSGLDSSTSNNCISLLKNLALDGRTVICTVHQPSALTFHMFDHLYALANGQCIYAGSTKNLVPYLAEIGLPCPEIYNPCDYLMEIATDDYGEQNHKLVAQMENGCNEEYRGEPQKMCGRQSSNGNFLPFSSLREMSFRSTDNMDNIKSRKSSRKTSMQHAHRPPLCQRTQVYATPFYKQVGILMLRTFLICWRDPSLLAMRFFIHTFIALLIGFLYWNIGNDAGHALNNFRYSYYSLMFVMFCAYSAMMVKFPLEVPIVARERFNRWYSLRAYYVGLTLADIPVQLACTCIYVFTTYYMTGQPLEMFRFGLFFLIIFLTAMTAQSIGLIIGAAMNIQLGSTMGTFLLAPFFAFSGFFLQHKDAIIYLRWMFHISFLKYGLDGAMLALFGYDRPTLECKALYCHHARPKFFLKDIDMLSADYERSAIFLIAVLFLLRLIAFYIMHFRLQLLRSY